MPTLMTCNGVLGAVVIPSVTATIKSSAPNAFQRASVLSPLTVARAASQIPGTAMAAVMMSPKPAEYGNGPLRRPAAARMKNSTANTRLTFNPTRSGIGTLSKAARAAG